MASPYHQELAAYEVAADQVVPAVLDTTSGGDDLPVALTYSQLASFMGCGVAFRLREMIGFQPRLATEMGYGKAVHHVMREMAAFTSAHGRVPDIGEIDAIIARDFFLPAAGMTLHQTLRDAAFRLATRYTVAYASDLHRVWETERPFELHLDGVVVSGRADVILDMEDGVPTAMAIVDYKTSADGGAEHALQLQVYSDAGRREGIDVRAAYVHDLKASSRHVVDVGPAAIQAAEQRVATAAAQIRARDYGARCRQCEVRTICKYASR